MKPMSDIKTAAIVGFLAGLAGTGVVLLVKSNSDQIKDALGSASPKLREVRRNPEVFGRQKLSSI